MPSIDYKSIKSYRLNKFTSIDDLVIVTGPIQPPQRGQVAVRIHAVSLNYRDYIIAIGRHSGAHRQSTESRHNLNNRLLIFCLLCGLYCFFAGKYPGAKTTSGGGLIPCSDGAGEVIEIGEGVTQFKVGDRVATTFHENWESGPAPQTTGSRALGGTAQGTLTEIGVYEEGSLVHLPDSLSFSEAATLTCAPVTAWTALRDTPFPIGPESTVLVQGTGTISTELTSISSSFAALSSLAPIILSPALLGSLNRCSHVISVLCCCVRARRWCVHLCYSASYRGRRPCNCYILI